MPSKGHLAICPIEGTPVTVTEHGQLALDLDGAMHDQDDLEERLRAAVAEDGMSPDEIDAAVEDARRRLGLGPVEARRARPCLCEHPQVFVDAFAEDRRCNLCGREPGPK